MSSAPASYDVGSFDQDIPYLFFNVVSVVNTASLGLGWSIGDPSNNQRIVSPGYAIIDSGSGQPAGFNFDNSNPWGMGTSFQDLAYNPSTQQFTYLRQIPTAGLGLSPIYGKDVRTGLTATDASATTLYTTTAAGQVYEVTARILGTGGTITSGVYTVGWTEGGTARTATVSITGAGTLASAVFLLQPDSGTAITGQLTTLSGTSPVVNVAAVVKEDV